MRGAAPAGAGGRRLCRKCGRARVCAGRDFRPLEQGSPCLAPASHAKLDMSCMALKLFWTSPLGACFLPCRLGSKQACDRLHMTAGRGPALREARACREVVGCARPADGPRPQVGLRKAATQEGPHFQNSVRVLTELGTLPPPRQSSMPFFVQESSSDRTWPLPRCSQEELCPPSQVPCPIWGSP